MWNNVFSWYREEFREESESVREDIALHVLQLLLQLSRVFAGQQWRRAKTHRTF